MPDKKALKGIGGWLLFFINSLAISTIIHPLSYEMESYNNSLYIIYGNLMGLEDFPMFLTMIKCLAWLSSLLEIYIIFILIKHQKKETIRTVIILLWSMNLTFPVLQLIILPQLIFGQTGLSNMHLYVLASSLIPASIWTLYFTKSRRIKNTYQ
jgi:hypothetical protein